ncbi:hypothetical protein MC885_019311, partial [Smutsia gigantea]
RVVNVSSTLSLIALKRCSPELQQKFTSENITEEELVELMNKFMEHTKNGVHLKESWPPMKFVPYAVSKVGLTVLSRIQARKLSERKTGDKILLNSCCPRWVRTDMGGAEALKSPEGGAETPVYLALLPSNAEGLQGEFVSEKKVVKWEPDSELPAWLQLYEAEADRHYVMEKNPVLAGDAHLFTQDIAGHKERQTKHGSSRNSPGRFGSSWAGRDTSGALFSGNDRTASQSHYKARCLDWGQASVTRPLDLFGRLQQHQPTQPSHVIPQPSGAGHWGQQGHWLGHRAQPVPAVLGDVVLTARDAAQGHAAVQQLQAEGLSPRFHLLDICNRQSIRALRDFLLKEYGGLDVLVNNAGINFNGRVVNVSSTLSLIALKRYSPELQQKFTSENITEEEFVELMNKLWNIRRMECTLRRAGLL